MSLETTTSIDDSIIDPKTPLVSARMILAQHRTPDGLDTIAFYGGDFRRWTSGTYIDYEDESVRRLAYRWGETKTMIVVRGEIETIEPFAPNKNKIDQIIDAMRAECHISQRFMPPCWLDAHDTERPKPNELLVGKNAIIHLPSFVAGEPYRTEPTPLFFNFNALDYDFDPMAPEPTEWLKFLDTLWSDDPSSIALLQEWFGYCLTSDTSQQKIMLIYGPKRSGKGTISRVLSRLLGLHNIANPTLSSLTTNFGLMPLIGKTLAIIGDARLSGRTDHAIITERLLSISGEDSLTIDQKNKAPLTTQLKTRIMILTNELPKLSDASGALSSRFVILRTDRSFFGQEDLGLTDRLYNELPAILLWAVEGWKRLREQGRFTEPASSAEAIRELDELGSPITAFVADRCIIAPGQYVETSELFRAWQVWCGEQGREHPGNIQSFGRDLGAAFPGVKRSRPRVEGERLRQYEGIGLRLGGY